MQALPIHQIIFYVYAALLVGAAFMVIVSRNPVRSALYLVLAFFCSAVLWMLLQAEFLSLVLIFVYVGAVMTLFLFVVMMINIDLVSLKEGFVRYLPYAVLIVVLLVGTMWLVITRQPLGQNTHFVVYGPNYDNTRALGILLYTHYRYALELAAFVLLVAIVAAIALAHHPRQSNTKAQLIDQQLQANKSNLRIIKMKAEKR